MTLFSIVGLGLVVFYVDPEASGLIGKILFYVVFIFSLSGAFNLFLIRLRKRITTEENAHANIVLSFRQSLLLAILTAGLLLMQSLRLLVWWDGLLLLAGIFLIEFYFLSKD